MSNNIEKICELDIIKKEKKKEKDISKCISAANKICSDLDNPESPLSKYFIKNKKYKIFGLNVDSYDKNNDNYSDLLRCSKYPEIEKLLENKLDKHFNNKIIFTFYTKRGLYFDYNPYGMKRKNKFYIRPYDYYIEY